MVCDGDKNVLETVLVNQMDGFFYIFFPEK